MWSSQAFGHLACAAGSILLCSGCAVHYYDQKSQTDHVFGLGHMRLRVPNDAEGTKAVVKGSTVVGMKIGAGLENYSIGAGYDSGYRIIIHSNDVSLRFEWPTSDGFNVRLGTKPPTWESIGTPKGTQHVTISTISANSTNNNHPTR